MNLRAVTKGLFSRLVESYGGQDAAGALLGITQQRISQLCNPACADDPRLVDHICPLEQALGQDIVTGALARLARNGSFEADDPAKEIGDVTLATADIMRLERTGAPAPKKQAAALRLVKEATEVADMYRGRSAGAA
jgi:hypothetical protein